MIALKLSGTTVGSYALCWPILVQQAAALAVNNQSQRCQGISSNSQRQRSPNKSDVAHMKDHEGTHMTEKALQNIDRKKKEEDSHTQQRERCCHLGRFCPLSPPCPLERQREVRKEGRRGWREERLQGKKIGGRNMRKNERKNGRRKERKKERMNQIILSSVRQAGKNISAWNPGNLSL